jgi:processive 1,2-diacylglycerol beta-glucosyltransferase
MPEERVHHAGFLLHPKFYAAPLSPNERAAKLRGELALDPERFVLLLATGANGAQNHAAFLEALHAAGLELQVVALCGRDEAARARLDARAAQLPGLIVRTLGYQDDLFAWLQCADTVVARPGTGTTSEAILAGCPICFNAVGGIMPQEWITVKYLRSQALPAPVLRHPRDLVAALQARLRDPSQLMEEQAAMRRLRPESTPDEFITCLRNLTLPHTGQTGALEAHN